jgi:hypothetical protein
VLEITQIGSVELSLNSSNVDKRKLIIGTINFFDHWLQPVPLQAGTACSSVFFDSDNGFTHDVSDCICGCERGADKSQFGFPFALRIHR